MLKLTRDLVAIVPVLDSDISKGGLYVPDQAKTRAKQGVVKYIGPEVKDISIGNYVFFPAYSGDAFHLEGEGILIIISEVEITAYLHDRSDIDPIDVPGLYFKDKQGEYWTATYSMVWQFAMEAVGNSGLIKVKDRLEEYRRRKVSKDRGEGKIAVIDGQEHRIKGGECFCYRLAVEFNGGICPDQECGQQLHLVTNREKKQQYYTCEACLRQWGK